MKTGDGYLDFRYGSLKYRIFRYCYLQSGKWIHNGEIQKEAINSEKSFEGSTTKRRIQEMINDGYLVGEVRNERGKNNLYVKYEK